MARRRRTRGLPRRPQVKECEEPPCIHVIYDWKRRIYRVFIEYLEDEGPVYMPLRSEELREAYKDVYLLLGEGFREAGPEETDFLARRYLGASLIVEEAAGEDEETAEGEEKE